MPDESRMAIIRFSGAFRFLSNFAEGFPVKWEGIEYPTSEHLYQAFKSQHRNVREEVARCKTPGQAKRMGSRLTLRDDWEENKLRLMRLVISLKFAPGTEAARLLLATKDADLVEGNTWGDTFWGECDGEGQNWLGRILMEQREALREQV